MINFVIVMSFFNPKDKFQNTVQQMEFIFWKLTTMFKLEDAFEDLYISKL